MMTLRPGSSFLLSALRSHDRYPIKIKRKKGTFNANNAFWQPGIDGLQLC